MHNQLPKLCEKVENEHRKRGSPPANLRQSGTSPKPIAAPVARLARGVGWLSAYVWSGRQIGRQTSSHGWVLVFVGVDGFEKHTGAACMGYTQIHTLGH